MSHRLSERNDKFMTALQFLADSTANDAIREKLREFPNRVYFPNFGNGDNIFKEGIDIDRVLFTVPGTNFKIYWYGFLITIGILLAMIYGFRRMKTVGIDPDRATDAVIGGLIGAIFGARFYYIIFNTEGMKFSEFFDIRDGGLAIYGGLIGAIIVGGIIAKVRKLKLTALLDVVAPCFLIGQCIGRWGNFFNQEAFGCNTDSLFGMSGGRIQEWITDQYPSTTYFANFGTTLDASQPVHPCFLYESLWCLLGFVLLAIFAKKIRRYDGQIFLIYICWYGAERAVVESLRTDSLVIGNVRVSQILAITCVVISIILQIAIGTKVKRMGVDYRMYKDTNESKQMLAEYEAAKFVKEPEDDTNEDTASTDEVAETDTTDSSESDETPAETDTNQTEKE